MDLPAKARFLDLAKEHLSATQNHINAELAQSRLALSGGAQELRDLEVESEDIRMVQAALLERTGFRIDELEKLLPSPYFTRCDLKFDGETHPYYFAKFPLSDQSIYSWTTPIAALRYEEPGPVTYATPEDGARQGTLLRKDQYMIVDGKIIFLTTEGLEQPRELIHQEYLSVKQGAFVLPEIVAQMEKAQDQVIRAHHAGPFVISGPAGSGKTTLALHRVAFLTQSPDSSRLYPSRSIIVFVQDSGTKDYFSHLLPELGIHNIRITTFAEWAFMVLNIKDGQFVTRPGDNEDERDAYEYAKVQAVRRPLPKYQKGSEFRLLEDHYAFTGKQCQLFAEQKKNRSFDRYDLTLLLQAYHKREHGFPDFQEFTIRLKDGRTRLQTKRLLREYPLIVIDEFQNYLPEQLRLLAGTVKKYPGSIIYVGDLAQQTQFGSIREWGDFDTAIQPDRNVRLQKVYRNTRRILEYIRSLGYDVEIPEGVKEGTKVVVIKPEDNIVYISELIKRLDKASVGVLAKDPDSLVPYKKAFKGNPQVRCLAIREAQGVEFDAVCLVEMKPDAFAVSQDSAFAEEQRRINRDLQYVALTRAMSELHVLCEL